MKILKEKFLVIHKFLNLQSKIHWSNNSKKKKKVDVIDPNINLECTCHIKT